MTFYADLHIHSKYSRATSRDCDLEHLALWGRKKGLQLIGTGDFTHPAWFKELSEKLIPAEDGLYQLAPAYEPPFTPQAEHNYGGPVRFLLQVEISTIYKKNGRTRKVHHLIFMPDLAAADCFRRKLDRIGNVKSDGRPILGMDSRSLLETALECSGQAMLIPAHIWTPWFAVLGSQSGFDSIEECYEDLAPQIFALETGLSSDPAMNWRLSGLDRYTLVSNSDAHSPQKLGREACIFDVPLAYANIRQALESGEGFSGTIEFFPEEGKYHLDGHRKCGLRFHPDETRQAQGICPHCGTGLTVGVLNRVVSLADRPAVVKPPRGRPPFRSLIPLPEIVAEVLGKGSGSKAVAACYERLLDRVGPEIFILLDAPLDTVEASAGPLLAEALSRMRSGQVNCEGGYDGEFGVIRVFGNRQRMQSVQVCTA